MKFDRIALVVALMAGGLSAWSAWGIRRVQTHLESLATELKSQQERINFLTPALTNVERRLKQGEAGSGGMGAVMSRVQMHFAKLYFAGESRNWDLARFERGELEENLTAAAALRPEERGVGIAGVMDAFKKTQLVALADAIDVKDRQLFREAYGEAVQMCNGCHQSTGRPFIYITVPTNPPVPNQRWELTGPGDSK